MKVMPWLQRRGGSSHLLHLRPRRRGARQRLDLPRPISAGRQEEW